MRNFIFISIAVCIGLSISYFINRSDYQNSIVLGTNSVKKIQPVNDQATEYTSNVNQSNDVNNTEDIAAELVEPKTSVPPSSNILSKEILVASKNNNVSERNVSAHAFQKGWDQKDYQAYLNYLNKAYGLPKNPKSKNRLIQSITNFEHDRFVDFTREVLRDEQTIQNYLSNLKLIEDKAQPNYKSSLIRQSKEKLSHRIIQELSRIDSINELQY